MMSIILYHTKHEHNVATVYLYIIIIIPHLCLHNTDMVPVTDFRNLRVTLGSTNAPVTGACAAGHGIKILGNSPSTVTLLCIYIRLVRVEYSGIPLIGYRSTAGVVTKQAWARVF